MVFMDKGYCTKDAQKTIKINECHSGAILKNSMKGKCFNKDRWLSSVRMLYEGTFSKIQKRARYRTTMKVQFQAFRQALSDNLKKLIKIEAPPLKVYAF